MRTFLLSILLFISSSISAYQYDLSMVAIFQDEARFLPEWIEYHKSQGVQHFWMYNNNSKDDYQSALKPFINKGLVELIEWPSIQESNDWSHFSFTVQPGAYNDALKRAKGVSRWLAINDTDEFILPLKHKNIRRLLKDKLEYAQVCIPWINFGTSHVERLAEKVSMLSQLTLRSKDDNPANDSFKSIVQPEHVQTCNHPHYCILNPGCKMMHAPRDEVRINHYWTRDNDFLMNVKVTRYLKWGADPSGILERASHFNEVYDDLIIRHVKK